MFAHRLSNYVRYFYLVSALLGVVLIFSPIVWMEIGPNGIAYYGPQVPDIWVYGGALTGKDLGFIPLLLIMLVQFAGILIGVMLSLVCFFRWRKRAVVILSVSIIMLFLLQFPSWITWYVAVIKGNSDGAASDLTIHWTYGTWIFIVIAALNISAVVIGSITYFARRRRPKLLPA